jgi:hypothetical protein
MRRHESRTALDDALARFQAEVQRLALAVARTVIEQELARRRAGIEPARPRKGRPAQPTRSQLELRFGQAPQPQLDLPLASQAAPEAAPRGAPAEPPREAEPADVSAAAVAPAPAPAPAPVTATPDSPTGRPAGARGRTRWTRDTIISELATWLLSGTAIDAQFMTRHGPKGLVAAIRRVFGRFDAALNLAALHNSRLYPDGPPTRGAGPGRPAIAAAAPHEAK